MDSALLVHRLHFAFTVTFHYLFPQLTMGLAPLIVVLKTLGLRRGDEAYNQAARFWARIFGINFVIGVVTGIPMEFQFGTNWSHFSRFAGGVIGQTLAMEGMFAFFLESAFLGLFLYGEKRLSPRAHWWSAVAVFLGSWLSGFFIVATDAWMQHPVGYAMSGTRIELTSLPAVLLSPFAWWQFVHVVCGALVAGGFVVAGVGAYYLLSKRETMLARRFVDAGVIVALVFSVLAIFPTGDRNSANVTEYQPIKLAAMEGLFKTTRGAPLAIIGMPDSQTQELIDPIFAPDVLSFLAYGNFTANVKGLRAYATALWPPVELTYYAYHVMVGLGTIFVAIAAVASLLLWQKRLFTTPIVLWLLLLVMPFPYIASEAGWVTTEVGRQPWIIYGIMRTAAGVSPTVAGGETIFTLVGFAGMYFLLGFLFLYLVLREIEQGPA